MYSPKETRKDLSDYDINRGVRPINLANYSTKPRPSMCDNLVYTNMITTINPRGLQKQRISAKAIITAAALTAALAMGGYGLHAYSMASTESFNEANAVVATEQISYLGGVYDLEICANGSGVFVLPNGQRAAEIQVRINGKTNSLIANNLAKKYIEEHQEELSDQLEEPKKNIKKSLKRFLFCLYRVLLFLFGLKYNQC